MQSLAVVADDLRKLEAGSSPLMGDLFLILHNPWHSWHTILKDSLLPNRNSGYCQDHLLFFKIKWKMHFLEEKWTCLFNCIDLGFSRCGFFNWKFCLETRFFISLLFSLLLKWGKLEHCFPNILVKTTPRMKSVWSLYFYYSIYFYFPINSCWLPAYRKSNKNACAISIWLHSFVI